MCTQINHQLIVPSSEFTSDSIPYPLHEWSEHLNIWFSFQSHLMELTQLCSQTENNNVVKKKLRITTQPSGLLQLIIWEHSGWTVFGPKCTSRIILCTGRRTDLLNRLEDRYNTTGYTRNWLQNENNRIRRKKSTVCSEFDPNHNASGHPSRAFAGLDYLLITRVKIWILATLTNRHFN